MFTALVLGVLGMGKCDLTVVIVTNMVTPVNGQNALPALSSITRLMPAQACLLVHVRVRTRMCFVSWRAAAGEGYWRCTPVHVVVIVTCN